MLVLCSVRLASADTASIAQHDQNSFQAPPEAKVIVWEREIVTLRAPYEEFSPQDRANNNMARILAIPTGEAEYRVEAVDAAEGKYKGAWIKVNGRFDLRQSFSPKAKRLIGSGPPIWIIPQK